VQVHTIDAAIDLRDANFDEGADERIERRGFEMFGDAGELIDSFRGYLIVVDS
jgi:hypothetical protein